MPICRNHLLIIRNYNFGIVNLILAQENNFSFAGSKVTLLYYLPLFVLYYLHFFHRYLVFNDKLSTKNTTSIIIISHIKKILNYVLIQESFKISVITTMQKKRKANIKNDHPISQISIIAKSFENIIKNKLVNYFKTNKLLSDHYYLFLYYINQKMYYISNNDYKILNFYCLLLMNN